MILKNAIKILVILFNYDWCYLTGKMVILLVVGRRGGDDVCRARDMRWGTH